MNLTSRARRHGLIEVLCGFLFFHRRIFFTIGFVLLWHDHSPQTKSKNLDARIAPARRQG